MLTRREMIMLYLERGFHSLQEISYKFGTDIKEIQEDFEHIKRSLGNDPERQLLMLPASCRNCGFEFKERKRIKRPSKCPECRHERIEPARFRIEKTVK